MVLIEEWLQISDKSQTGRQCTEPWLHETRMSQKRLQDVKLKRRMFSRIRGCSKISHLEISREFTTWLTVFCDAILQRFISTLRVISETVFKWGTHENFAQLPAPYLTDEVTLHDLILPYWPYLTLHDPPYLTDDIIWSDLIFNR